MATFYLLVQKNTVEGVPAGAPTWNAANIATNSGWTAGAGGTIAYHDADADPGTGSTYQFTPNVSGLMAGTPYDLWAVWYDGEMTTGPVHGSSFTTASAEVFGPAFYLAIYPVGAAAPTWSPTNIGTNSGWSGSPVYHDADVDPGTGSTYQFTPDASGLTPGTSYDTYAVRYDGVMTVGPVQGTRFTTVSAAVTYNEFLSESATLADTLADSVATGPTFAVSLAEVVAAGDFVDVTYTGPSAGPSTGPRKALTARITALSFAARVETCET